jgi:hypothetical protein
MSNPHRYYRPRPGLVVRDPIDGTPLPAHGKGLVWSSFWQRRLDDGDLEETNQKAVEAAEKKAAEGGSEKGAA